MHKGDRETAETPEIRMTRRLFLPHPVEVVSGGKQTGELGIGTPGIWLHTRLCWSQGIKSPGSCLQLRGTAEKPPSTGWSGPTGTSTRFKLTDSTAAGLATGGASRPQSTSSSSPRGPTDSRSLGSSGAWSGGRHEPSPSTVSEDSGCPGPLGAAGRRRSRAGREWHGPRKEGVLSYSFTERP